jgi:hypothetical protein
VEVLAHRPLHTTVDYLLGIENFAGPRLSAARKGSSSEAMVSGATSSVFSRLSHQPLIDSANSVKASTRVLVRILVTAMVIVIAIFLPDFDRGKYLAYPGVRRKMTNIG